jgi:hypothetical protein
MEPVRRIAKILGITPPFVLDHSMQGEHFCDLDGPGVLVLWLKFDLTPEEKYELRAYGFTVAYVHHCARCKQITYYYA